MNGSSRFACIDGFAEELDEIIYEGISNWFISFRSLFTVYSAHFSYLFIFFCIISCGLLSYRHSVENGRKFTQFWWGALLHGVVSEQGLTSRKYWHAQAPVMFLGKQLPLHVVFLYPSIIYVAMMGVQRLQLNTCTEPAAVGLIAMLMEIPYRMISVKFLHITYHDSDPLYYHKLCGVPWVEIFSSLTLASSYVALYHGAQFYRSRDLSTIWDSSKPDKKETAITALCGILSPVAGFLQKIVLFNFLHDVFNVNPIACLFFATSVYISFAVCFEPKRVGKSVTENTQSKAYLFYQVAIFLSCLLCLGLFGKPQNEISIGSHEPTGDCTTLVCSRTPLGKEIQRKKFLCAYDICNRPHFLYDFDCVPNGAPALNAMWYTICGTSFRNRLNFLVLISSFVLLTFSFFMTTLFKKLLRILPVKRKKYLCADEIAARKHFAYNFDCLEEGPPCLSAVWYTICGSPIHNRVQFFLNLLSFIILISTFFAKKLLADVKNLEVAKRLIVRFKRTTLQEEPQEVEPSPLESGEEVTVGFVLVKNDVRFLPKSFLSVKKDVS